MLAQGMQPDIFWRQVDVAKAAGCGNSSVIPYAVKFNIPIMKIGGVAHFYADDGEKLAVLIRKAQNKPAPNPVEQLQKTWGML